MTRLRSYLVTFAVLFGLSIYLSSDLIAYQSMARFDGQARAESLLLGVIVGLLAVVVGLVCRLWLQWALESTRVEDRFTRASSDHITPIYSEYQMEPLDETRLLAEHVDTLRWWKDECIEERVWGLDPDLLESVGSIRR